MSEKRRPFAPFESSMSLSWTSSLPHSEPAPFAHSPDIRPRSQGAADDPTWLGAVRPYVRDLGHPVHAYQGRGRRRDTGTRAGFRANRDRRRAAPAPGVARRAVGGGPAVLEAGSRVRLPGD